MNKDAPHLDAAEVLRRLQSARAPWQASYYAMYSSVYGGIVTDPALMLVPADDHVVHRGDGVFDTLKCVNGNLYNVAAHLARLRMSAGHIGLAVPRSDEQLVDLLVQTVRAGGHREAQIRLLVSRGPGSLAVNPYDCPDPQVYIVAAALEPPFMTRHPGGARAKFSALPAKPPFFATLKSCNYLPNVLMKKEAVDAGVDFVAGLDEDGHLAEGPTENFMIVSPELRLEAPEGEHILMGTTMARVLELARQLVPDDGLTAVARTRISRQSMAGARELLVVGTTRDVIAVTEFEGQPVADGRPGPVWERLSRLLTEDIRHNRALQTPVFG